MQILIDEGFAENHSVVENSVLALIILNAVGTERVCEGSYLKLAELHLLCWILNKHLVSLRLALLIQTILLTVFAEQIILLINIKHIIVAGAKHVAEIEYCYTNAVIVL